MQRKNVRILFEDSCYQVSLSRKLLPTSLRQLARDGGYRVAFLCAAFEISERHLRRVFMECIGTAPKEWLSTERMIAARILLRRGSSIKEVAADLGYATPKMLARDFGRTYGLKPSVYQRKAELDRLAAIV